MKPYYEDDAVTLYNGDMRKLLPDIACQPHAAITDPPYGQTAHTWDQWQPGWITTTALVTPALWCFGTMRMFLGHVLEFHEWQFSQDIIWSKPRVTNMATDRFGRAHEMACLFYRGQWADIHHDTPREAHHGKRISNGVMGTAVPHWGQTPNREWTDDGTRIMRSVIEAPSARNGHNETAKPQAVLDALIRYSVPAGGLVIDPFAGSGSVAIAARNAGRRALLIEAREQQCETIVNRLAQTSIMDTP